MSSPPPDRRAERAGRRERRFELLTCAFRGHALVGTDVAELTPDDAPMAREMDGHRWYRCLRCDGWIVRARPTAPGRQRMPDRSEIELPPRGRELRDRWVLRLIAVDRAIHVVVLTLLAVALFTFASHDQVLHQDYTRIMGDLSGATPGEAQVRGVLGYLGRAFKYSPHTLVRLGLLMLLLATLEAFEMVGLWMARRWAEYLTFVATVFFVPLEVYELTSGVSVLKVVALVLNLVIATYLLYAKRLFGVRGGYRTERERRERERGWAAIDGMVPGGAPSPVAVPIAVVADGADAAPARSAGSSGTF